MDTLAQAVVIGTALWLIGLATAAVAVPEHTARFLSSFASSARAHYTEQALRLAAGAALVAFASEMRFPEVFRIFGWVLALTAAALLITPWRWHRRFGEWAIPLAIRRLKLVALGSLALGAFILYSAL